MKLNNNKIGLRPAAMLFSVVIAAAVVFFTGYTLVAAGDPADFSDSAKMVDRAEAAPGDMVEYTIVVSNTGGAIASGAMMTDALPADLVYQMGTLTLTESTNASVTYGYDNGVITMTGDFLTGGHATLMFGATLTDTLTNGDAVTNTAHIDWNGTSVMKTAVTDIVIAPAAFGSSTKTVDQTEASPGNALAYTVVVSNSGDVAASGVMMTDTLPADLVYQMGTLTMTDAMDASATYGYDSGVITMTGTFSGGGHVTLTFDAVLTNTLVNGDMVTNTAYIGWNGTTVMKTAVTDIQVMEPTTTTVYIPVVSKAFPQPPAPTLQSTRPNSANQWTLSWNDIGDNVISYEIQEAQTPDFVGATTYNPPLTVADVLIASLPWNNDAPYMPSMPASDVMVLNNALPVRSQEPDFANATTQLVNADTSQTYAHALSWKNEYFYRVRAIADSGGPWAGVGEWSDVVQVVGGYRDDFDDWSSGWDDGAGSGRRRLTNIDLTAAYYGYNGDEQGKFIIIVGDRWDWLLASPLKKAPEPPYAIEYRAKVHDGSNLISGGMAFGGDWDGSSACPDWSTIEGVYQHTNCFNQFYNYNYIFYGPIKLLHEQVDELVWCPECGTSPMKRLGVTTLVDPTGGIISNADGLKWHTYRVEVRDDGSRLFIDDNQIYRFPDTTYNDQPYFGVFASADEYKPSIWFYDYFQVSPLD